MDYDKVNNPFITLRKLSGDSEQSFTTKLNTSPPTLNNDKYMSDMKKSDESTYSDNRSHKMRMDNETISFDNYSITLMDIDNILYEYFINVINPQVEDSGGTLVSVPVRHASPERWSAIQSDGVFRDQKGQVQKPIIIFTRTNVAKDDSFIHFNRYVSVPFLKQFDSKNMYDRFSSLTNTNRQYEVHNITFPDHVVLTYDFTMTTEYVQQMNSLIERINWVNDDYWGDPKKFKFRASIDSFANSVEVPSDDDRVVSTTFSLNVNAYLIPDVFNNTKTAQRNLTNRKVVFGTELISDEPDTSQVPPTPALPRKKLTLNRSNREVFIKGDVGDEYEVRMWNDEESYSVNLGKDVYDVTTEVVDEEDVFVWNYNSDDEVYLKLHDVHEIYVGDKKVHIETHCNSTDVFKIKYIS